MATWRRCKQKFAWSYRDNYYLGSSEGQRRGTVGHVALAKWYETYSANEALHAASNKLEEFERELETTLDHEWELLSTVLQRYFEWSDNNDFFEEILATELKFDLDMGGVPITGYIDLIVKDKQSIWLMENKFQKQASLKHIQLDPQVSMYMLAAYKLGYNPRGTIYNVIRVAKGGIAETEPVLRAKVYRNHEGLEVIEKEMITQAKEMHTFLIEGGDVYRNPTKDCHWDCGFYGVCLGVNDDGDADSVLKMYQVREPVQKEGDLNE